MNCTLHNQIDPVYAEMIQDKVASELFEMIATVIDSPDYLSKDGFFLFIEICHNNPSTVSQIQHRALKASTKKGKQFDAISDQPEDLDEYLPPSENIVNIIEQKYYQQHG